MLGTILRGVTVGLLVLTVGLMSAGTHNVTAAPGNLAWTTANLSLARQIPAAASAVGKALFAGGTTVTGLPTDVVDIYDSQSGNWTTAHLSLARTELAATASGTKVYIGGGVHIDNQGSATYVSTVNVYDVGAGTWSMTDLSEGRTMLAATAVGTKVIFAGGWRGGDLFSSVVDIYDTQTGGWTTTSLSQPRAFRVGTHATAVGTKALFAGGWASTGGSSVVDIYDSQTGVWTTAALSQARWGIAATTVGNKALFAGGYTGTAASNVVDVFDGATGAWSTTTLSQARNSVAATTLGTKAIFAGGAVSAISSAVDIYDSESDTWSTASLAEARYALAAAAVGGKALFAAGGTSAGMSAVVDVATLVPPSTIAVHAGNNQTAASGATLAPFQARVTDASGNPVAGVPVAWRVSGMPLGAISQRLDGVEQKIAFSSTRTGNSEIYLMEIGGGSQTQFTSSPPAAASGAAWSPDGTRVAFHVDQHGLYVKSVTGGTQSRLTSSGEVSPVWSPDGTKIAFVAHRGGNYDIFVLNPDGTQTNLTSSAADESKPAWSPDGTRIAYASNVDGNWNIFVMNANGTGPKTRLTTEPGSDVSPAWSPDSSQIAFMSDRDSVWDLYVMNALGGLAQRTTSVPEGDYAPTWSPDGGRIGFHSTRSSNDNIYVMSANGDAQAAITNDPADDTYPDWSPAISYTDANGVATATFTLGTLAGAYQITATCVACTTTKTAVFTATAAQPNTPPSVAPASNLTVPEGTTAANTGTYADPDAGQNVTITASVGSVTKTGTNSGTWAWWYATTDGPAQSQTVTVTANDGNGGAATTTFSLAVTNVPPTITALTGPPGPVAVNTLAPVTAAYTDSGTVDTHTCTFVWQGGPTSSPVAASAGGCAHTHTYTAAGVYTVTVTVADDDGGSDTEVYTYVVVFDPNGGFVTGAGRILSPVGACTVTTACETATGNAIFGFQSRYQHGATEPTGNTSFRFQAGGLVFESTSYEWLVVAGARAQFKGSGTIQSQPGTSYSFLLTAIDGQEPGGGGVDKFRLKISGPGGVVYDNMRGATDDPEPGNAQALASGQVVIHH